MATDLIQINEVFGPTIQGEGSAAGQHCMFIRTFGCNLTCRWCDTAKTWAVTPALAAKTESGKQYDKLEQSAQMTVDDVIHALLMRWDIQKKPTLIVISGGEPMMQKIQLMPLIRKLFDWGNRIHIETAGTIKTLPDLDVMVEQYNVSPKLDNSGNAASKRFKPDVIDNLLHTGKAWFKFVVRYRDDLDEIDYIVASTGIPRHRVMIMPEGDKIQQNITGARNLVDEALARGWGLSLRSHILIWPGREGV